MFDVHTHTNITSSSKRTAETLLQHTMDVIPFPLDASIGIELSNMSVPLTINVIIFSPDLSIDTVSSAMSVVIPILEFSNAIPVIPIKSAHPMWYLIDMFPTVPGPLTNLEALLGCKGQHRGGEKKSQ